MSHAYPAFPYSKLQWPVSIHPFFELFSWKVKFPPLYTKLLNERLQIPKPAVAGAVSGPRRTRNAADIFA